MKRFLPVIFLMLILSACNNKEMEVAVSSVSLNQATAEMIIGETVQLQVSISPSNATDKTVLWGSSKQSVATVSDSGYVTAISEGSSTITATAGGKSATCQVTVSKGYIAVTSVTLNKTELTLEKGKSETLTATVNPSDATDKTVTWSSSNSSVATVDAGGKIAAVAGGSTVITAKAGNQQATCNVTVIVPVESISLDREAITLEEESSTTLVATVKPDDATDKKVTWTSSDTQTATVDETGKVTAIKEGSTTITAKAGEKSATCSVTVQKKIIAVTSVTLNRAELTLEKGQSETLVATVKPDDATDKTVSWSTSDSGIVTVDNSGKVTAIAGGNATITAKAGEKEATCVVTVIVPVESVTLDQNSVTIEEGQTVTLTATVSPEDATDKTVTWSSSDEAVAKVEKGVVTAIKEGSATVTAKSGDKTATCKVTVQKKVIAVTSVTLNKTSLSLEKGKSETLIATVKPDDATDKTVTWSSSDASIATVDSNGKVIAIGVGEANITAKAGEKTATCKVIVKNDSSQVISFADSNIKVKLVAAFDTDGDGELSYVEAAAVSSGDDLKAAFGSVKAYTSFDEFQFFTGITILPYALFKDWTVISSITLPNTIIDLGTESFMNCTKLDNLSIPKSVIDLGAGTFYGCHSLSSLTIPDGVTRLYSHVFRDCSSLTTIDIPEGVTAIGEYAFYGCTRLSSIFIPNNVTSIGSYAFWACNGLVSINIPEKINHIGTYAFNCDNLQDLHIGNLSAYLSVLNDKNHPMYSSKQKCRLFINGIELTELIIPEGIMSEIPREAFKRCINLTSVIIPIGVSQIGQWAFSGCSSLQSIVFPEGITSIGREAFIGCTSLEFVIIPEDISMIEIGTFKDCTNLTSVKIPENVTLIRSSAFENCSSLTSIKIPKNVSIIADRVFENCHSMSSITVFALTPPEMYSSFNNTNNCPIYVPVESVNTYKVADGWKEYADRIQAIGGGPKAVDLGLSVKWASINLGATRPEEYGDYYAWGETEPYYETGYSQSATPLWKQGKEEGYNWASYKWINSDYTRVTKYCSENNTERWAGTGSPDGKLILDLEDDAAHVVLGGAWRIPTRAEFDELISQCDWTWTTENGINGFRVTGNNGNSIFLPAAGYRARAELKSVGTECFYTSSSVRPDGATSTFCLWAAKYVGRTWTARYVGHPIRPVKE